MGELQWDLDAVRAGLAPRWPATIVEVVAETGSTNTDLLEQARDAAHAASMARDDAALRGPVRRSIESTAFAGSATRPAFVPRLLVAEQQNGGRGRLGRRWFGERGASLTFSLAVALDAADWSGLSLAVGVAVADAIEPLGPSAATAPRLALKWPNDLCLVDRAAAPRKLGGVLIETLALGSARIAVIGIGVNIRTWAAPGELATGFAAVQELDPDATAPLLLARIVPALADALPRFERSGFAAFRDRFAARDLLAGRPVTTTRPGLKAGVAAGVDSRGALLVRGADGALVAVASGEVSVRLDTDARDCARAGELAMLRALVIVLVLANLAFFGWAQGWFDDIVGIRARGDREPERLAKQVHADRVIVIPAAALTRTAAAPATPACLEAGPFAPTELGAAEAALQGAVPKAIWTDVRSERQAMWLVYLGSYPDRDTLQRKSDELHRLHLDAEEIAAPGESPFGLALARVEGRANAEHALGQFVQRGVRSARLLPLSPRTVTHMLRVEKADPSVAAQLGALGDSVLGKRFVACAAADAAR